MIEYDYNQYPDYSQLLLSYQQIQNQLTYYEYYLQYLDRKYDQLFTKYHTTQVVNNSEFARNRKRIRDVEHRVIEMEHKSDHQLKRLRSVPIEIQIDKLSSKPVGEINQTIDSAIHAEVGKYLVDLNNISDIINLKQIVPPDKLIRLKQNRKFKILYDSIEPLEDLNRLIGLDEIKADLFRHICFFTNELNSGQDLMHVVIMGPPGVGKSEVGKIIGKLYAKLGFLATDKFKTFKRSDLIAEYLGQTAIKTQKAINESLGGVMFIDEAYSLGNNEKRDSFSKECIDTLNQNLTENGNKFLCIIAGYEDDLNQCFFSHNKGLDRRFNIRYNIKGYSASELTRIFLLKLDKWKIEDEQYISDLIHQNHADYFKYFGGDIDTLISKIKFEYAIRNIKLPVNSGLVLTKNDIEQGFLEFKKNREPRTDVFLPMYS